MKLTRKQAEAAGIEWPHKNGKGKEPPKRKPTGPSHIGPTPAQKAFRALCKVHGLPDPVEEFEFAREALGRLWRFDWLFDGWLALEIQGGLFIEGRHAQGAALLKEHEKLFAAAELGYVVVFCTPHDVDSGAVFPRIKRVLAAREEQP